VTRFAGIGSTRGRFLRGLRTGRVLRPGKPWQTGFKCLFGGTWQTARRIGAGGVGGFSRRSPSLVRDRGLRGLFSQGGGGNPSEQLFGGHFACQLWRTLFFRGPPEQEPRRARIIRPLRRSPKCYRRTRGFKAKWVSRSFPADPHRWRCHRPGG